MDNIVGGRKKGEQDEPLLRHVMPELDLLRRVAIIGVLFYRGLYWGVDLSRFSKLAQLMLRGMWMERLGVSLFFVLSGFLITGLLIDSRGRADYYPRFYVRRALRILPAFLLTTVVLATLTNVPRIFIVLSILYLSNITPIFGIEIAYPVLWSLAVEEQFYLVWPTVVRRLRNRPLMSLCVLVPSLSFRGVRLLNETEANQLDESRPAVARESLPKIKRKAHACLAL
jgi:peptidoglycan/LPS O-acetylase OafA/YrhL